MGINLEDLNSRSAAVAILIVLDLIFLGVTIYVYKGNSYPIELKTLISTSFAGWNGALAVALNSRNSTPPSNNPPTNNLPPTK